MTLDSAYNTAAAQFKAFTGNFNVEDTATRVSGGTPITIPGTGVFTKLTNDGLGSLTTTENAPTGMVPLWRPSTDDFSFAQLAKGDQIIMRIDLRVITASPNTEIEVRLQAGIGEFSFEIEWDDVFYKISDNHPLSRTSLVTMDTDTILDGTAEFQMASDTACTVAVIGWNYIINRRSI